MVERNHRAYDAYVADTIFPSGYVRQLQPALLSYVAATAGFLPPNPGGPFTFLELGCGTGATLNVFAAANPESRFIGVDLNPAHIALARDDASKGDLGNVTYIERSFEDIKPDELPECDYIAIHGTYSWLPPSSQEGVHEILRRKLRIGGLFLIDYLCAPGRAPIDPVWVFLREITRSIAGTSEQRVAEGMETLKQLGAAKTGYFAATPPARAALARNLQRIDSRMPNILARLAHRGLAQAQKSSYFFEIQEAMSLCGLRFAGNSSTARNDPALCLPSEFMDLYFSQDEPGIRELVKDFLLNETQRKDVFVKAEGPDEAAAGDYLRQSVFVFAMRPAAAVLNRWNKDFQTWKTRHEPEPAAELILECIDKGQSTLSEFERAASERSIAFEQLIRALNLLIDRREIHLCRKAPRPSAPVTQFGISSSDPYGRSAPGRPDTLGKARVVLASPVLGAGLLLGQGQSAILEPTLRNETGTNAKDLGEASTADAVASAKRRKQEAKLLSRLAQLEIME